MKSIVVCFLFLLSLTSIACIKPRNLKFERDPEKYKVLCSVANKTVYQLFNRTIDFKDRYDAYIQQTDMMVVKVVVDEYGVFPNYPNQTTFEINNGQPIIPDLQVPREASFDVYGAKDLQEELKAFANMVAAGYAGYEYGNVTIYRKETSFTAQGRFMCFVKNRNGQLYGSFEILQEDLNDRKDLITRIDNFLKKLKNIAEVIAGRIRIVGELCGTLRGIYKDINNIVTGASSFISMSNLLLIIALAL